jgi:hypothetical protein
MLPPEFNHGQLDAAVGHYTAVLRNKPHNMTAYLNSLPHVCPAASGWGIKSHNKIKPDNTIIQGVFKKTLKN